MRNNSYFSSFLAATAIVMNTWTITSANAQSATATTWQSVVSEGDSFIAAANLKIRYGNTKDFVTREVISSGVIECNNTTFKDAAINTSKSCLVEKSSLSNQRVAKYRTKIADEHENFSTPAGAIVEYGAENQWISRTVGKQGACNNNFFGVDPIKGVSKTCYQISNPENSLKPLALLTQSDDAKILDTVSDDAELYSSVPFGKTPSNGFYYLNNTFGKGNYLNGVDYFLRLKAIRSDFPNNSVVEWSWPQLGSGAPFAFAYPEIFYGGGPFGNPYKTIGPWPQRLNEISKLSARYDISLGGNTNSYNVLMDMYATELPNTDDGSYVAEISFFPHLNDPHSLGKIINFQSFGLASVSKVGRQILIRPITQTATPRSILRGTIDLKEIFTYLIKSGHLTGKEFLRGIEFGAEIQVPNQYNSTPHIGSLRINNITYDWK